MFKMLVKSAAVAVVVAASALIPTGIASAHTGSASGKCENGVGVITADFQYFGDRGKMLGNITVSVNNQQVDAFVPTADSFTKTYKPYQNGTYTVSAAWVLDENGNKKADNNEHYGFTDTVKIDGCTPKVEKCTIPGKENLNKDDANCKVDMCEVPGKTNLPKDDKNCKVDMCTVEGKTNLPANDANCKEDVKKCTVAGKTDLDATDKNCKEDEKPAVLPDTGSGTGLLIALPTFAVVAGTLLKRRSYAQR